MPTEPYALTTTCETNTQKRQILEHFFSWQDQRRRLPVMYENKTYACVALKHVLLSVIHIGKKIQDFLTTIHTPGGHLSSSSPTRLDPNAVKRIEGLQETTVS